jgi:predicted transposase
MPLPITLSFKLSFERKEEREQVIKLMRLQSSAIRFIYNRLKEGKTDNEIYKLTQERFNSFGRNPEQGRVAKTILQSAWQVLRVAVPFPILGRTSSRGLSPLKPVLVEGVWDRVKNRLAPVGLAGAGS